MSLDHPNTNDIILLHVICHLLVGGDKVKPDITKEVELVSQWIEQVKGHAIWGELKALGPVIENALARETITSDNILALERIRSVLTYYDRRLASTDPALVPLVHLDSVIANFRSVNSQVTAFTANGDANQLVSANGQADAILLSLAAVPSLVNSEGLTWISEAAANYQKTLASYLAAALSTQQVLSKLSEDNQATIAQIRETIDVQKVQLANTLTEQQSLFSKAQDERASIFAATQAEQLGKFSQAISEQQTQFSSDQDSRRKAFTNFELDIEAKAEKIISDYDAKLKEHDGTFKQNEYTLTAAHQATLAQLEKDFIIDGQKKLAEVEQQKIAIEKLVGIIGNHGVTYGYQQQANIARQTLLVWQGLTVLSLAGLIFVAFLMVFPGIFPSLQESRANVPHLVVATGASDKKPVTSASAQAATTTLTATAEIRASELEFYRGLATRIFLSLTFGIFATYAARQARHFMAIEQRNRKMALELQALGPFIEPLPETDQHKFRIQIGDRSFGVPDYNHEQPKGDDPVTIPGLLKSKEFEQFISDRLSDTLKAFKLGG